MRRRDDRPSCRPHDQLPKTVSFRLLPGPGFHTIEPEFVGMLVTAGGTELMGVSNAWISEMERGRDGPWAHDCNVSCGTERGLG
jgi:hypothetical protein